MSSDPILFLVSRGLLDHKPRMGMAIWTYLWFLDKVTEDVPDGKGKFDGLVLGGRPFKTELIANDLKDHVQTVLQNVRKLEVEGYVIRKRHSGNLCSFIVTNSKKWFWRRESEKTHSRESENTHSVPPDKANTLSQSEPKHSLRVSENTSAYKEGQDRDTTKNNKRPSAFDASSLELPDWLPRDSWQEFVEHRKAQKPLTELAAKKTLKILDGLRGGGHDPRAVIDQSIANGWTGLFELKRGHSNGRVATEAVKQVSAVEQLRRVM